MVDTVIHNILSTTNNHNPFFRVYANSTARLADSTLVTGDLLKMAFQQSDSTVWVLTSLTPTWEGLFPVGVLKGVAGMYMYEANQTIAINVVNKYHGVYGYTVGPVIEGFTFLAGLTGVITNTANNGGILRVTDAAHGLTTGQYVTLNGMGNPAHGAETRVTVIDLNTFDCDDIAYSSSGDTGYWQRGASLTVSSGYGGTYVMNYSASIKPLANNKNFRFELAKNLTSLDNFAVENKLALTSDLQNMAASGVCVLADGDVIWQKCKGTTDATDLIIQHANVHIFKL